MEATLILPQWLILSGDRPPEPEWGVLVIDDVIVDVGPNQDLITRHPEADRWQATEAVLAPGFVNAHSHLYGVLAHGIPLERAPSGFWSFLEEFWWPLVEDRLDHDMVCAATDLQCARMLLSGVTSFYDCTEAPSALPGVLATQAQAVNKWGMRGVLSFEATERVSPENGLLGLEENAQFIKASQEKYPLISGLMCFHTTFTCSAEFIKRAVEMGQELAVPVHMHCAEGTYEPEHALANFGQRTIHYYDELGVLGRHTLASQCVQVDPSEIEVMAERGVAMTHMPLSNCEVGGGIAPVPELVQSGVTVGLGSDGYIDDFFEVMRGAFLIHKASHQDPRVMPADLVWQLATEGGARALGLEKVGRIEEGWQADLQLIDAKLPTPLSRHNLFEQMLLYRGAEDVLATIVAGQARVRNGQLAAGDLDQLRANAHHAAERLWQGAS